MLSEQMHMCRAVFLQGISMDRQGIWASENPERGASSPSISWAARTIPPVPRATVLRSTCFFFLRPISGVAVSDRRDNLTLCMHSLPSIDCL